MGISQDSPLPPLQGIVTDEEAVIVQGNDGSRVTM